MGGNFAIDDVLMIELASLNSVVWAPYVPSTAHLPPTKFDTADSRSRFFLLEAEDELD